MLLLMLIYNRLTGSSYSPAEAARTYIVAGEARNYSVAGNMRIYIVPVDK